MVVFARIRETPRLKSAVGPFGASVVISLREPRRLRLVIFTRDRRAGNGLAAVGYRCGDCRAGMGVGIRSQPFEGCCHVCLGGGVFERSVRAEQPPADSCSVGRLVQHDPDLPAAKLGALASGVPGLLFDQEFGIFAYAPVLLLGFVGLAGMARDRSLRALSASLIVGCLLVALAGSLDPWWSESMMPGRTVLLLCRSWPRLLRGCTRVLTNIRCAEQACSYSCWRAWG